MQTETSVGDMKVLVVDDNHHNAELLEQILTGAGYNEVRVCADAEAVPRLCTHTLQPDLLVLDLIMPGISGHEILGRLRPILRGEPYLPVLVVTADVTPRAKHRALSLGASDFVTKPVDPTEFLLRVSHLLRARKLRLRLTDIVAARTAELEQARHETLEHLVVAAECRDDNTGHHTHRVGRTAGLLASALGLPEPIRAQIVAAAPLHDVGKIGIPDEILLKNGPLTATEATVMRRHVEIGARILGGGANYLSVAHEIALYHHERWDGSGYLHGLARDNIPVSARITAVADVFDALTHSRPYKEAWPIEAAAAEISAQRGRQFDPVVVDAFAQLDHQDLASPRELATEETGRLQTPTPATLGSHDGQAGESEELRKRRTLCR
jgi:putative two-component system response regulator